MRSYESPKKSLRSLSVSSGLQEYIDHIAILVNSSPQVVQLAINLHEDLINKESISVPLVFALQTPGVLGTKLVAPQTDRFMTYHDATLSQKILNISVTQAKPIEEPDRLADDFRREPVALVCVHRQSLANYTS